MKKRRIISLLLAAVLLFTCAVPAFAAAKPGDIDGSGHITSDDARMVLRFAVKLEAPDTTQRTMSDIDEDGAITANDARCVLRMAVNLDSPLSLTLASYAHRYYNMTFREIHPNVLTPMETVLDSISEWCCYYLLHDVYRPVLRKLGYTEQKIEQVAPAKYSKDKLAKAFSGAAKINVPEWMALTSVEWYVPSLLIDYYLEHPEYAETYVFWEYYDDIIAEKVIKPTENVNSYLPQVGDIIFMSNKERTYAEVNGKIYPTVDHPALIIEVYPDGSFLCTEGSIIQNNEDGKARVRERVYAFDYDKDTYVFVNNPVVNVVAIVRPDLSE